MANENAQPELLPVTFAKGSDVGRARDHNEDYVDAFSPPDPAQRQQKGDLYIVADGMGGHQAGDVASRSAVQVVSHEYYADPELDLRVSLINAIKQANTYIYDEAQQTASHAGMGTTVVAAVVRGRELYLANVGDSRAYLMREGKVNQATRDHSFVADQVRAGLLTPEEARAHPQRNVITRALGSRPEVKVDTYSGELLSGDVLLLCSDGLSEYVHEEDMLSVLGHYPPEEAVARLIALANERGGSDNISTIVIQIGQRPKVAITQPMAPVKTGLQQPPRRRALPWVIGIGAFLALAAVALAVVLIVGPSLFGREESATSTPEPQATNDLTPTTVTSPTPLPTESPPTATPAFSLTGLQPADGAVVEPGDVIFSWGPINWADRFTATIRSDGQELCQTADANQCQAIMPVGTYNWWIEISVDGKTLYKGDPHGLTVQELTAVTPATPITSTDTVTSTATVTETVAN
jgi:serine/threonine protein phosphatase PrpC